MYTAITLHGKRASLPASLILWGCHRPLITKCNALKIQWQFRQPRQYSCGRLKCRSGSRGEIPLVGTYPGSKQPVFEMEIVKIKPCDYCGPVSSSLPHSSMRRKVPPRHTSSSLLLSSFGSVYTTECISTVNLF